MSKHTPGPWVAVSRTNAHIDIEAPKQHGYVARHVASTGHGNHEANARLITAAPELLEALKRIRATGVFVGAIAQEMMDEAIAKAEGRS
jgi:hypothetical protein